MNSLDISRWLWDFYMLASGLLLATGVASFLIAQPARRMAMAWGTAGGLVLLLMLTGVPNWSRYSLVSPALPEPVGNVVIEPVLNTAVRLTPQTVADPVDSQIKIIPAAQIVTIDWGSLATLVLSTGSSIVAVWLLLGVWQVRSLRARAQAVPQNIADLLAEFPSQPSVQLGTHTDLPVPVALGLRRPMILLPQTLLSRANPTELRSVLAHELAHVENRDLWLLALLRLLMILLWPHPLFWLMRSRVRHDQEVLADMAAAELTTRTTYAEQLVALARTVAATRVPRLVSSVGLWEKPSQLTQRIKLLLDDKLMILQSCSRNWRLGTVAVLGGLAIGLSLVTLTPAEVEEAKNKEQQAEQTPTYSPSSPNDISGRVRDEAGEPLAGVTVDAWSWYSGNETVTDDSGHFVLKGLNDEDRGGIEVQFTKPGYCPAYFVTMPIGTKDWNIPLNSRTFLEGQVIGPDNKPVPHAKVRASRGPFDNPIVRISEVWTDTEADSDGKYRLYLEPDTYNVQVHVPNVGLARHENTVLKDGDQRKFDVQLQEGPTFRAKIVDSETGDPVEGIRLWNWRQKGIEGVSDEDGMLVIENMLPGMFEFVVSTTSTAPYDSLAGEYARWWSAEGADEFSRKQEFAPPDIQRNIDELKFNITDNMEPVTIFVEKVVKIAGQVVDPEGKPVSGATVAPARTGTGNSLTGDTRYSVRTDGDGKFLVRLPASGKAKYHLIAHDGDYQEWRTWANGIGEPLQTKPGETIEKVLLQLTRPCIVRGNVVDQNGDPVVGGEVIAEPVDNRDIRYYLPSTKTNAKGEFELRHVRPGKHTLNFNGNAANQRSEVDAQPEKPVDGVKLSLTQYEKSRLFSTAMGDFELEIDRSVEPSPLASKSETRNSTQLELQKPDDSLSKLEPNTITGICLDENGKPLSGVDVELYVRPLQGKESESRKLQSTVSNVEGKFAFESVVDIAKEVPNGFKKEDEIFPPENAKVYVVVGRKEGRVKGFSNGMLSQVAKYGKVAVIAMPLSQSLQGLITDEMGKPVVDAEVAFGPSALGFPSAFATVKTDSQGQFLLTHLEGYDAIEAQSAYEREHGKQREDRRYPTWLPWQRLLTISHPKFATKYVPIDKIPGRMEITLDVGTLLTGRVLTQEHGGSPEPAGSVELNVKCSMSDPRTGEDLRPVTLHIASNSDGVYRTEEVEAGPVTVTANTAGWFGQPVEFVADADSLNQAPDLILTRGGRIRIQLIDDETGKPMEFATPTKAFVVPQPLPRGNQIDTVVVFSSNGVGEQQLPAGNYRFLVSVPEIDGRTELKDKVFSTIRDIDLLDQYPSHEVVEGEVRDIEVRMMKVDRPSKAQITGAVINDAGPNAERKPDTKFVPTIPPAETEKKEDVPDKNAGRPPKLRYLAWLPETRSESWENVTFWDPSGKDLPETEAKAFLARVGPLGVSRLEGRGLTPLMLFFEVDMSIDAPVMPTMKTKEGVIISTGSSRIQPVDGFNMSVVAGQRKELLASHDVVSFEFDYATENWHVIKTVREVGDQPIEIAEGVGWYLDSERARINNPETGRLEWAKGKTTAVLEISEAVRRSLTNYGVRLYLKGQSTPMREAYVTVVTRDDGNSTIRVSEPFESADQIERVEFISQKHAIETIDNVPLRLDLLPKVSSLSVPEVRNAAYEDAVFDRRPAIRQ